MKRIGILFLFLALSLAAGYGQNSLLLTSNGVTSNYIRFNGINSALFTDTRFSNGIMHLEIGNPRP